MPLVMLRETRPGVRIESVLVLAAVLLAAGPAFAHGEQHVLLLPLGNFAAFVTVLILAARAKIRWLLRLLAIAVVLMVSFFSNGALMPSRVSDPVPAWANSFPLGVFLLGLVPPLILAFPFLRAERATMNADQEPGAPTDPDAD